MATGPPGVGTSQEDHVAVGQRELLWERDYPQVLFPCPRVHSRLGLWGWGGGRRWVKVREPRAGAGGLEKLQGLYLRASFFFFFFFAEEKNDLNPL